MPKHEKPVRNSCGMCCTKIIDLSVCYSSEPVLDHINLHIHCGELTAIIGPNGAGKSTLLKALIGIIPHSGSVIFTDANNENTSRPKFGYVPQYLDTDRNAPISVLDLFAVSDSRFPAWLGTSRMLRCQALALLREVDADRLIDRRIGALSGGELQRVLLALALKSKPDILLLDEPVSGMDRNGIELFYGAIDRVRKQYDLTIILISHNLAQVSNYADRMVLLNKKILASGDCKTVLSSPEFKRLFENGGGLE